MWNTVCMYNCKYVCGGWGGREGKEDEEIPVFSQILACSCPELCMLSPCLYWVQGWFILVLYPSYTEIRFTAEPQSIDVACGSGRNAVFHCKYEGEKNIQLRWIINSITYNLSMLPPDHHYINGTHTLSVTNIKLWQNDTTYQCQLLPDKEQQCAYHSTIGRLIFKCKGNN